MKAAFPLAGGALNEGSTCGVVSGGCLAIALARGGELSSGGDADAEEVYRELRDYTRWFEKSFGSTLCRGRTGIGFTEKLGIADLPLLARVVPRCLTHTGRAVDHVLAKRSPKRPKCGSDALVTSGLCAAPVLEGIKEDTGLGDPLLSEASVALDGGIGLSGGLCGALAAALVVLGEQTGIDPREAGIVGTMRAAVEGVSAAQTGRSSASPFSTSIPLVKRFKEEFGSLECGSITGRSLENLDDLRACMAACDRCSNIKDWCRRESSAALLG